MLVVDWRLWAERRGRGGENRDGGRPTRGEQRRNTRDVQNIGNFME